MILQQIVYEVICDSCEGKLASEYELDDARFCAKFYGMIEIGDKHFCTNCAEIETQLVESANAQR